jgi:hypothetical protein
VTTRPVYKNNILFLYYFRHSCALLPRNQDGDEEILIVSQLARAFIYNVQNGKTRITGRPYFNRGFASLENINDQYLIIGGNHHAKLVEKYDTITGTFHTLEEKIIKGR